MSDQTDAEDAASNATTEPEGRLTPDGNMDLVDDYGSAVKSGKQFITFTTKNGNYFWRSWKRKIQMMRLIKKTRQILRSKGLRTV